VSRSWKVVVADKVIKISHHHVRRCSASTTTRSARQATRRARRRGTTTIPRRTIRAPQPPSRRASRRSLRTNASRTWAPWPTTVRHPGPGQPLSANARVWINAEMTQAGALPRRRATPAACAPMPPLPRRQVRHQGSVQTAHLRRLLPRAAVFHYEVASTSTAARRSARAPPPHTSCESSWPSRGRSATTWPRAAPSSKRATQSSPSSSPSSSRSPSSTTPYSSRPSTPPRSCARSSSPSTPGGGSHCSPVLLSK
jgi:hypothetical protein